MSDEAGLFNFHSQHGRLESTGRRSAACDWEVPTGLRPSMGWNALLSSKDVGIGKPSDKWSPHWVCKEQVDQGMVTRLHSYDEKTSQLPRRPERYDLHFRLDSCGIFDGSRKQENEGQASLGRSGFRRGMPISDRSLGIRPPHKLPNISCFPLYRPHLLHQSKDTSPVKAVKCLSW